MKMEMALLRMQICEADSYLSLVLHRHLKPDTPHDLRQDIEAVVGRLRATYDAMADPSPAARPQEELWALTYDFANQAGICERSTKWHEESPCETCQGLVNYARRAAALLADNKMADAAEMLWVVLANVSGGDWTQQTPDWQEAAARWRDHYFAALTETRPPPSLRAQIEQIEAELLMAKACLHEVATDPEAWIDGCLERCRTLLALYGAPAKIDTSSWDNPVMNASADALKEPKR